MPFVTSERKRINVEDVQFSTSVSEAVGNKLGASINFIFDRIVQKLVFGVIGAPYSSLVTPYTGLGTNETLVEAYEISRLSVSQAVCGTSGQTEFYLERRPFGSGIWTSMFSVNCIISNTASDPVSFTSDGVAPAGVTLPVFNLTNLGEGDEIRLVLFSSANQAQDLTINLEVRPA